MPKLIENVNDIIGHYFGRWKVLAYIGPKRESNAIRQLYLVQCRGCGKAYSIRRDALFHSRSLMCSYCSRNRSGSILFTGSPGNITEDGEAAIFSDRR